MTKDYATLLAQVIPVLALAIGLEVRSAATRVNRSRTRNLLVLFVGVLWFVQVSLAVIEFKALSVVHGRATPMDYELPLVAGIGVAFLAPILEASVRLLAPTLKRSDT